LNCVTVAAPSVVREKRQTAREVAGRQPVTHCWDWQEPRLMVCEAEFVDAVNGPDSQSTSTATDGQKGSKPLGVQAVSSSYTLLSLI